MCNRSLNLSRRMAAAVLALAYIVPAMPSLAANAKPQTSPATVTFAEPNVIGSISSDGLGSYVNGKDGVQSIFQSSGDLGLITNYTTSVSVRKISLDFSAPVPITGIDPGTGPFVGTTLTVPGFVGVVLFTEDMWGNPTGPATGGLLGMPADGTPHPARLALQFDSGQPTVWQILFNPLQYPTTKSAVVTRSTIGNTWTVEAPVGQDIARLRALVHLNGGRTRIDDYGNFHLTCKFTILQP